VTVYTCLILQRMSYSYDRSSFLIPGCTLPCVQQGSHFTVISSSMTGLAGWRRGVVITLVLAAAMHHIILTIIPLPQLGAQVVPPPLHPLHLDWVAPGAPMVTTPVSLAGGDRDQRPLYAAGWRWCSSFSCEDCCRQ
jgi:hypothetical protein